MATLTKKTETRRRLRDNRLLKRRLKNSNKKNQKAKKKN